LSVDIGSVAAARAVSQNTTQHSLLCWWKLSDTRHVCTVTLTVSQTQLEHCVCHQVQKDGDN